MEERKTLRKLLVENSVRMLERGDILLKRLEELPETDETTAVIRQYRDLAYQENEIIYTKEFNTWLNGVQFQFSAESAGSAKFEQDSPASEEDTDQLIIELRLNLYTYK